MSLAAEIQVRKKTPFEPKPNNKELRVLLGRHPFYPGARALKKLRRWGQKSSAKSSQQEGVSAAFTGEDCEKAACLSSAPKLSSLCQELLFVAAAASLLWMSCCPPCRLLKPQALFLFPSAALLCSYHFLKGSGTKVHELLLQPRLTTELAA